MPALPSYLRQLQQSGCLLICQVFCVNCIHPKYAGGWGFASEPSKKPINNGEQLANPVFGWEARTFSHCALPLLFLRAKAATTFSVS